MQVEEKQALKNLAQLEEIYRKDHTYDHKGHLLAVKQVKADRLPRLTGKNAEMSVRDDNKGSKNRVSKTAAQRKKSKDPTSMMDALAKDMKAKVNHELLQSDSEGEIPKGNFSIKDKI